MTTQARRLMSAGWCALLVLSFSACGEGRSPDGGQSASNSPNANASNTVAAGDGDISKLDGEIARLEKEAERNPGDESARTTLSQAYLQRANAHRAAQRLPDALNDYQSALRNDPDNEQAQQGIAEISPQMENNPTGENGEPAPLPITPNVTGGQDSPTPAVETPTPTPKSRKS